MKRYVLILMVLTLLALPLVAGADDQTIPPEANWTPTPPASPTVNARELMEVLVRKGFLAPIDQSQLTQSPVVIRTEDLREMNIRNDGD